MVNFMLCEFTLTDHLIKEKPPQWERLDSERPVRAAVADQRGRDAGRRKRPERTLRGAERFQMGGTT